MTYWRLIVHPRPLRGSFNMAFDEFLFSSLTEGPGTFLRFYQWERPTASLGRSQNIDGVIDLDYCGSHGVDVVRRITGGKLVLHHEEVTYSVCSSDAGLFTPTLAGSYRLISQALIKGLEHMGLAGALADKAPPFYAKGTMPCFSHPAQDEIEVGGRKIIGSAQMRTGPRFLQHGSIPLAYDGALLKAVAAMTDDPAEIRMTSLSEELGFPVAADWAEERLIAGFEEFFGVRWAPITFTADDLNRIAEIEARRYANPEWTLRGPSAEKKL
jgi:lipoyl(octanoyl) transferase